MAIDFRPAAAAAPDQVGLQADNGIAAAGGAARVTIARIDAKGQPTVVATGASVDGVRNIVADDSGNAYAADGANARLLVFAYAP